MLLRLALVTMALALSGVSKLAFAQTYPVKPIKLIVPFPPGGGTDVISRVIAAEITEATKWTFVIENKPGAGGNVGLDLAAKSAPDGYTIVMGQTSNLAVNPALYPKLLYDPIKDFRPIALVGSSPVALVVAADSAFKSFTDIASAAKTKPGELTMATPGNGTIGHLSGEMIQVAAGFKLLHVPYKGASQAIMDLLGGRIDVYMSTVPAALAQIKGGKMRALAVTSLARNAELPGVPSLAELGHKDFEAESWYGLLAPSGVSDEIVRALNQSSLRALQSDAVRQKFAGEGVSPLGGTPQAFADHIAREMPRWASIVKSSGAKVD